MLAPSTGPERKLCTTHSPCGKDMENLQYDFKAANWRKKEKKRNKTCAQWSKSPELIQSVELIQLFLDPFLKNFVLIKSSIISMRDRWILFSVLTCHWCLWSTWNQHWNYSIYFNQFLVFCAGFIQNNQNKIIKVSISIYLHCSQQRMLATFLKPVRYWETLGH